MQLSLSFDSQFDGHVVVEAAEPHSALEVVAVADGLYTLRYRTDDAWRGHEVTRAADDLVPFGFLPKRASGEADHDLPRRLVAARARRR